jgi:hypothetical protein
MAGLDDLINLVRPPDHIPIQIDWGVVEAGLGTPLPADYKALIETYGPGTFDDFLTVFQPGTPFLTIELAFQARRSEQILNQLRDQGREIIPFPPGELLPAAGTDNGDTLYWIKRPTEESDAWTITGNEARNTIWPQFPGGLAAFLHAVLSRAIRFPIFPDDFPSPRPTFTSEEPPDPRQVAKLKAQGLYRDL